MLQHGVLGSVTNDLRQISAAGCIEGSILASAVVGLGSLKVFPRRFFSEITVLCATLAERTLTWVNLAVFVGTRHDQQPLGDATFISTRCNFSRSIALVYQPTCATRVRLRRYGSSRHSQSPSSCFGGSPKPYECLQTWCFKRIRACRHTHHLCIMGFHVCTSIICAMRMCYPVPALLGLECLALASSAPNTVRNAINF